MGGYVAAGVELGFCAQEEGSGIDVGPATSHVCHHARFSHRGSGVCFHFKLSEINL